MRFSRFHFLTSIAAMLSFASCITVDKTLGDEYIPSDDIISMGTITLNLPMEQQKMDSLRTSNSDFHVLGYMNTQELGYSDFSFAAEVYPASNTIDLGKDAVVTRAYLTIPVSSSHILSPEEKKIMQEIEIFKLKDQLDTNWLYNNSAAGKDFYETTPVNIQSVEYFGGDSLNAYISNDYATHLITATREELDTTKRYLKTHRGLYFKMKSPAYNKLGGRVNLFTFGGGTIFVWVNFQPTWAPNLQKKDTILTFDIGYDRSLNISSYSSEGLISADGEAPRGEIYYEGIAGIKPYISGAALKDTLDKWMDSMGADHKKVLIAKATFNIPFNKNALLAGDNLTYPSSLFVNNRIKDTATNKVDYVPIDDVKNSGNPLGAMNRSLATYIGDMTSYVHTLIQKDKGEIVRDGDKYNLWLTPLASTSDYYGNSSYKTETNYYYFGKVNGPANANPPTITILYTVLN